MTLVLVPLPRVRTSTAGRAGCCRAKCCVVCMKEPDSEKASVDVCSECRRTALLDASYQSHSLQDTKERRASQFIAGYIRLGLFWNRGFTLDQFPVFQMAQGRRLHRRAGSGFFTLAQSSSRSELQATDRHTAPRPHVVEHWDEKYILGMHGSVRFLCKKLIRLFSKQHETC